MLPGVFMSGGPKARHLRPVPCGGSRTACRRPGRVASSRAPSPGGSMLPGVLYADGLRGRSGFPTPAKGSLVRFRRAPRYLSVRRPPPARASGFILPRACRLLQSSTACDLPRGPTTSRRAECEAPPLGFLALIAAPASGVHQYAGYPTPRYVPSSAFHTPPTVCSATCLAGLFRPAATSRVCPPGDCPSRGAVPGFPGPFMPSWRWTRKACGVTRASPSRPRLQGFLSPRRVR